MSGTKNVIIGLGGVVLFAFLIFGFFGGFIGETNPTSEVFGSRYGYNSSVQNLQSSIEEFNDVSEDIKIQLAESEPSAVDYLFLIFKGAFYIPIALLTFGYSAISTLVLTLIPAIGGTMLGTAVTVSLNVLFSILVIYLVLVLVRFIRGGDER
jgi:hypothetical protein